MARRSQTRSYILARLYPLSCVTQYRGQKLQHQMLEFLHIPLAAKILAWFAIQSCRRTDCREVVERHPNTTVAVFAHSETIDAALCWVVGLAPDTIWQHKFNLPTASITEITYWSRAQVQGGSLQYTVIRQIGAVVHLDAHVSEI
ncbi:MAG: hypothetical protein CYG59_01170 [Chloroflexi bacterium]|nr:MAG: hypothetical protein CYG59_01170 [Chloroflexota bacterium]